MKISVDVLRTLPILKHLSDAELSGCQSWLNAVKFKTGEILISQGEQSPALFIVLQGSLEISLLDIEFNTVGVMFVGPGKFVGELSIVDGIPSSATVSAAEPTWTLKIPREAAQTLIRENHLITQEITAHLAKALRTSNERLMMLSARSQWRVYYFLRSIGARQGKQIIGKIPTHQTIASMIHLSRETVTRTLKDLKKIGLIQLGVLNEEKVFIIETEQKTRVANQARANC